MHSDSQKFLDHATLVANNPLFVLAHLGFARAQALQGDTDKSRAAYQDFFTLWKDADQDIPILKQAKAEYAKLQCWWSAVSIEHSCPNYRLSGS